MTAQPLQPSDIPLLLALEENTFPDFWSESAWQSAFARPDFFGFTLKEEGKLLGFVCGTALFEESELLKIAVDSAERKKGYGKILLKALQTECKARGAEKLFLEVREGNIPARRLYEGDGFTLLRLRKKYYHDGENALEMNKTL